MSRARRFGFGAWGIAAIGLVTLWVSGVQAMYLDEDQDVVFRARIYSQASIRLENSQHDTVPSTKAGQLVQHRNFYNPELEAKLTKYTAWMRGSFLDWLRPDDLSFRLAAWGFYDGIYDWGSSQFNAAQRRTNSTAVQIKPDGPRSSWILEGDRFRRPPEGQAATVSQIFPDFEIRNPRDTYAQQNRINELYLNYNKGPLFVRVGRQFISWGESDTIALLDQNDPFDTTVAAPGLFMDVEEARIPLWTVRASVNLFNALGPFSSGFLEAYWVPGDLDTNTGLLPMPGGASPYGPAQGDPEMQVPEFLRPSLQIVLLDRIPEKRFGNSRYGFRFQTVLNRYFTLQTWLYTYFPTAPSPRGLGQVKATNGTDDVTLIVTETVHKKSLTFGISNSFFVEPPLDGIVRMQVSYFENEPSFVAEKGLCSEGNAFDCRGSTVPADFVRWELGFDRFFFFRPLNPTNSFIWVSAIVGSWNLDETSVKDFRFSGQMKPGEVGVGQAPKTENFVQLKKVELFAQSHIQTDYMHGRVSPGLTVLGDKRGTYFIVPEVNIRWSDSLLFNVKLIHIDGDYQGVGFFRDRDQIWFRTTYQLN